MDKYVITKGHLDQEKQLDMKTQSLARKEEEDWHLRSRNLWLKGGDLNTKLFHNQCKDRQRSNTIMELTKYNIVKLTDQEVIKKKIKRFFENLYSTKDEATREEMEVMRN